MKASGNTSNCTPRPAASAISPSARSMVAGVSSRTVAVCATAAMSFVHGEPPCSQNTASASHDRKPQARSRSVRPPRAAIVSPAMAKEKTSYTCTECGGTSPRWLGKCPHCEAWNTLIETVAEAARRQPQPLRLAGQDRRGRGAGRHRGQRDRAHAHRHRRTRPRAGRRHRRRRRGADRRRPGHRQVDAAAAGARRPAARRRCRRSTSPARKAAPRWRCARAGSAWTTRRSRCWPRSSWKRSSPPSPPSSRRSR